MSIYSGFGTRQQEKSYNKILYHLLFLMQLKITKDLVNEPFCWEKFEHVFKKLYQKLAYSDNSKYLPPRFSYAVKDLAEYYGIFIDVEAKGGDNYLASQASTSSLTTISKLHSATTTSTGKKQFSSKSINKPKNEQMRSENFNLETIKETVNK
jgi:hypothetical protein